MSAVLEAEGLVRCFGAHRAVDGVSFAVREGEMLGLIGPNGAGKTTVFNLLTGFVRAERGSVRLAGRALDGLGPPARARRGLQRTFQRPALLPALSVTENLVLAGLRRMTARAAEGEARRLVAAAGLRRTGTERAGALAHGEARVLDTLMAVMAGPRVLLLDEPTAGLGAAESEALIALVRREVPCAVLVAHDVALVMRRCDRVAVLAAGRLLCCGTPASVRADGAVQAAYLGGPAA